jgi:hypothetical protein
MAGKLREPCCLIVYMPELRHASMHST